MIKLVCVKCKKTWYTANTEKNQKCDDCGGELKITDVKKTDKMEAKVQ